jgi:hypothetical protein
MLKEAHKEKLRTKYAIDPDHPIVADMIAAGLLRSVDREEAARLLARDPSSLESGGIYIEYPNTGGRFFAIRFDVPPRNAEGKETKYLRPAGRRNALFVPLGFDPDTATEIWLTEGEFKALSAWLRGLPVVAVPGVDSWRTRPDSEPLADAILAAQDAETRDLPDEVALLPELNRRWDGKSWVLWYDSDISREHPAWRAFPRLAEQLYRLGAESVKILTVPAVAAGKCGLDDYILAREAEGGDPAAELALLAASARTWLPTKAGARPHAEALLARVKARIAAGDKAAWASDDAKRAVACLMAADPAAAEAAIQELTRDRKARSALRASAAALLKEAREEQAPKAAPKSANSEATFASCFPPAASTPFADWPIPEGFAVTEDGRVWRVKIALAEDGPREVLVPVSATPIVPAKILVPIAGPDDAGVGIEYEIWWWWPAEEAWRKRKIPAAALNSHRIAEILAAHDVPVGPDNRREVTVWLGALRDMRVQLPDRVRLKEQAVVGATGWIALPGGAEAFACGPEILTPEGREAAEVDARGEADPEDPLAEWRDDLGTNERQILEAMAVEGTLEGQLETFLRYANKYPLAAFVAGAAAAGPLLKYIVDEGDLEIAGFLVDISGPAGQGKTTLNAFAASIWGRPRIGRGGFIRTAHRTVVHSEILFSMHNDMACCIDESQQERVSDVVAGIIYSLGLGQGKERGARHGGGRKTRYFNTVCVLSTERSVLHMVARDGIHHRVLPLPPLFPCKSEEYAKESVRIRQELMKNYGHLGRRLVLRLLGMPPARRKETIMEAYRFWKHVLEDAVDEVVPAVDEASTERNQVAKRLASRAAACVAGLDLALRACGVEDAVREDLVWRAADAGWDHVLAAFTVRPMAVRLADALRSHIFENRERIEGMRTDLSKTPSVWLGKQFEQGGRRYVALAPHPLRRVFREAADEVYESAVDCLRRVGIVADARSVRMPAEVHWMLVVDYDALMQFGAEPSGGKGAGGPAGAGAPGAAGSGAPPEEGEEPGF